MPGSVKCERLQSWLGRTAGPIKVLPSMKLSCAVLLSSSSPSHHNFPCNFEKMLENSRNKSNANFGRFVVLFDLSGKIANNLHGQIMLTFSTSKTS